MLKVFSVNEDCRPRKFIAEAGIWLKPGDIAKRSAGAMQSVVAISASRLKFLFSIEAVAVKTG